MPTSTDNVFFAPSPCDPSFGQASPATKQPIILSTNTYSLTHPGYPKRSKSSGVDSTALAFPVSSIVGSIGELAEVLSEGTEVPIEFYFACGLTLLGAYTCGELSVHVGLPVDTRLYTVLLGESYSVKKSTALKATIKFFETIVRSQTPAIEYGMGSAEGLARLLSENPHLLAGYDELRGLIDKCTITGSTLLPMITSLFEQHHWGNSTKDKQKSAKVSNAHLSLLACCTRATYEQIWRPEAIAIGLPNRLFVVGADAKPKVAVPSIPDPSRLTAIGERIRRQLNTLPKTLCMTPHAGEAWAEWYNHLPSSPHANRLDTIGWRLLALIALASDKEFIDEETVYYVVEILKYELDFRMLTDPIDADNHIAKLEENIRRQLKRFSPLTERELKQKVNANRVGIWAFDHAIKNLESSGELCRDRKVYRWKEDLPEAA